MYALMLADSLPCTQAELNVPFFCFCFFLLHRFLGSLNVSTKTYKFQRWRLWSFSCRVGAVCRGWDVLSLSLDSILGCLLGVFQWWFLCNEVHIPGEFVLFQAFSWRIWCFKFKCSLTFGCFWIVSVCSLRRCVHFLSKNAMQPRVQT